MTRAEDDVLRASHDRGVATVQLNRPARANAVDAPLAARAGELITELGHRPEVRALVLTGTGATFCGGADLRSLAADLGPDGVHPLVEVVEAVLACPVPTLAALNGAARGGGVELALACDIRVGDERATLALPEIGFGGLPGAGGLALLPRTVGLAAALELVLTGRVLTAAEALGLGLLDWLAPSGRALPDALALAHRLAVAPRELTVLAARDLRAARGDPASGAVTATTRALVAALTAAGSSTPSVPEPTSAINGRHAHDG